jgi:hypothetical protein
MVNTGGTERHPVATERLMEFWAHGPGAARIQWDVPGDYARCIVEIQKAVTDDGRPPLSDRVIHGLCSNLHVRATGARPGHGPSEQGASHHG